MDERIAVHDAPDFWSGHEGADGHYTAAQCLSSSDDIRCNIPMFNTPQLTGAAHTCLHFVSDQQDFIFIAELAQVRPEIAGGTIAPASPCTGSMMTAAISLPTSRAIRNCCSTAPASPYGT